MPSAVRIQNVEHAGAISARIDDLFMQSLKRSWWTTALGALVAAEANCTRCIGPCLCPSRAIGAQETLGEQLAGQALLAQCFA
jgi:hypothetical protein